jgi:hypothetical protein
MSGNILRVIKATSPSPYQCDLEVWMDMVSKEEGVQIPAAAQGQFQKKLSMYVSLDKRTCEFQLGGIGSDKDPSTVVDGKTPSLTKPHDYVEKVREEQAGAIQYAFDSLGSLASGAFNAIKTYLKEYRLTTFAAVGDLATLEGCPERKCSDPYLMDAFIRKYEDNNWQQSRIKQILRAGTYDGLTCDYTYEIEPVGLTPDGRPTTLPVVTTRGSRAKLQKEAGTGCAFRVVSEEPVYPSPSWDQIRDLSNTQFDRTNEFDAAAINYVNRRAIRYVDCGGAKAINQIVTFDNDITKIVAIKNAFINQCIAEVETFNKTTKRLVYTFDIDQNNDYTIKPYLEGQLLTNRTVSSTPPDIICDREPEVYLINNTDTNAMNFSDYNYSTGNFSNNTGNIRYAASRCALYGGRLATLAEINTAIKNGMTQPSNGVYGIISDGRLFDLGTASTIAAKSVATSLGVVVPTILCFGKKPDRSTVPEADVTRPFKSSSWAYGDLITHRVNGQKTCTWCPPGVNLGGTGCISKGTTLLTKPVCTVTGETLYVGRDGAKCYTPCASGIPIGFICAQRMPNTDVTNLNVGNVRTNINVSFEKLLPETLLPTTDCNGRSINRCLDGSGAIIQYFDCNRALIPCNTCSVTEINCSVGGQTTFDPMVGTEFYGQRVYSLERIDKSTCRAKVLNAQEEKTAPTYGDVWKFFRFYQEPDTNFQGSNCTIKLNRIDPIGCTNVLSCDVPGLDPIAGTMFNGVRVYASDKVDENTCEVRVLSRAEAIAAKSYTEVYKRMRFEQNPLDCGFYFKSLTPAVCTKSVNCFIGDLDRTTGADFYGRRVYRSEQVDPNTCRLKIMNDAAITAAPTTTTFGQTTELVRFRTNTTTCTVEETEKVPAQCTQPIFTVPTTINPVTGVDLYGVRVYDARQIGPMIVEARIMSNAEAARSFVYEDIYKIIRYKYNKACQIVEDARWNSKNDTQINLITEINTKPPIVADLSPVLPDLTTIPTGAKFTSQYNGLLGVNKSTAGALKKLMELTRTFINTNKSDWVLGKFITYGLEQSNSIIYRVTLAIKYDTQWVYRYNNINNNNNNNGRGDCMYIRAVYRPGETATSDPIVQSVTMLPIRSDASAAFTAFPPGITETAIEPAATPNLNNDLNSTIPRYASKYTGTTGEYAKMHTFNTGDATQRAAFLEAIRRFSAASSTQKVGRITRYTSISNNNQATFKAEYGVLNSTTGNYSEYYPDTATAANIRVTFGYINGGGANPEVISIERVDTPPANYTTLTTAFVIDLYFPLRTIDAEEYTALRAFIASDSSKRLGKLYKSAYVSSKTSSPFRVEYEAEYGEVNNEGYYTFYSNKGILQVEYSVSGTSNGPLTVTSITRPTTASVTLADIAATSQGTELYYPLRTIGTAAYDALRAYIATDTTKRVGLLKSQLSQITTDRFRVVYKGEYAEVDSGGFYTDYADNKAMQVDYLVPSSSNIPMLVTLFTPLAADPTGTFTNITPNNGTAIPTPSNNITRFKEIRFIVTALRSGTILQLFRFQLFKQGVALDPASYQITDTATPTATTLRVPDQDPRDSSVAALDTLPVYSKTATAAVSISAPIILYIQPTDPNAYIDADAFSFVTGNTTAADPTKWLIIGMANMISRYQRLLAGTLAATTTITTPLKDQNSFTTTNFTVATGVYTSPAPYIYYRHPITYFNNFTAPTGGAALSQLESRPYTFAECGLAVNDIRLIRYVSDVVKNQISRLMPSGFSESESFINRYYLKGIDNYEQKIIDDTTQIIYRPVIQRLNADYTVTDNINSATAALSTLFNGGTFPGVRLIFKLRQNCSPVPINGGGLGEVVTNYLTTTGGATSTTRTAYTANTYTLKLGRDDAPTTEAIPFGWGGITFQTLSNYDRYSGVTINNIGKLTLTQYIEDGSSINKNITLSQSGDYSTIASSGGAMVCSGTNSCLGFVQSGTTAGFFHGVPRADTTLTSGLGANVNTFIKNEYKLFRFIRLTISGVRLSTTAVSFNKMKFYADNTANSTIINSKTITSNNITWPYYDTAVNTASTTSGMKYNNTTPTSVIQNMGNAFTDGYIDLELPFNNTTTSNNVLTIKFENPVIANKYGITTNKINRDTDLLKWLVEVSIDGTNWTRWDDKTANTTQMPDERRAEVIFTPSTNTRAVVLDPNPPTKSLASCNNKTPLDIIFIEQLSNYVKNTYKGQNTADDYKNRYFLKGISGYRVENISGNNYIIIYKPQVQNIDENLTVIDMPDNANLSFVGITFSINNNCEISFDPYTFTEFNRYNWVSLNTSTTRNDIPLTNVTTQPVLGTASTFGWGGLTKKYSVIIQNYRIEPYQDFSVTRSLVGSPNPAYTETKGSPMEDSIGSYVFSSVNDNNIIGFQYDKSGSGEGRYIKGDVIPRPIDDPSKDLYLQSGFRIIKRITLTTLVLYGGTTYSGDAGISKMLLSKIILYINNTVVSRNISYTASLKVDTFTGAAFTGTTATNNNDELKKSLALNTNARAVLNLSVSPAVNGVLTELRYVITFILDTPVIANRFTLFGGQASSNPRNMANWRIVTQETDVSSMNSWDDKLLNTSGQANRITEAIAPVGNQFEFYSFPARSPYTGITFTYASVTEGGNFFRAEGIQDMRVIEPMESRSIPKPPTIPRALESKPLTPVQYLRFQPLALGARGKSLRLGKLAFFGPAGLITNVKGAAITTLNGTDRLFERAGAPTAAAVFDYHSLESEWIDSGLGTLLIALAEPQQLTAFALLTGSDPAAAPVKWRLEGSADGRSWMPLHTQIGSPATLPTTPFTQSLVYPFESGKAPYRIPALFELSLTAAGKRCDDPALLETVYHEMATDAAPRLFNPVAAKPSGAMCEYRQADDTLVRVAFQTDLTGGSRVKTLEVVGTPRARTTSWEEEDLWTGRPRITRGLQPPPRIPSPLDERGFGLADRPGPNEISSLQEVFTLPLKQADGFIDVYSPQITKKDDAATPTVKYVRFRCTKTRGAGGGVALGSFALWARRGQELELRRATASNPMGKWSGTVEDLAENNSAARGFRDAAGTPLVIAFPEPVPVAGFSWKTPAAAGTETTDPVRWKLEGSANGTYWFTLHDQARDYATPMERGWRLPLFWFNGDVPLFR